MRCLVKRREFLALLSGPFAERSDAARAQVSRVGRQMTSDQPVRPWIRPVRLGCGLLMLTYLLTHFSNHALGLISLQVMEAGRIWFLTLWRNPVGEAAL